MLPGAAGAEYPHFAEMVTAFALKPDYSYAAEFEFGLELILDGLEREASAPADAQPPAAVLTAGASAGAEGHASS